VKSKVQNDIGTIGLHYLLRPNRGRGGGKNARGNISATR